MQARNDGSVIVVGGALAHSDDGCAIFYGARSRNRDEYYATRYNRNSETARPTRTYIYFLYMIHLCLRGQYNWLVAPYCK